MTSTNPIRVVLAVSSSALVALSLAVATTQAAPYDWDNAAGGAYQTPGNWSPAGPPVAGDSAHFGLGATYTVNFTGPAASDSVLVDGTDAVTFDLAGNTYTVGTAALTNSTTINDTATLVISSAGGGGTYNSLSNGPGATNLTVAAGATLRINDSLGSPVTFVQNHRVLFNGTIEVSGVGVAYNNNLDGSDWTLGDASVLNVLDGATFTAANMTMSLGGADGAITVSGTGSQITSRNTARMIPDAGTVNIINGGTWHANGQFEMGVFFNTGGTVTVGNGVGSSLLNADNILMGVTGFNDLRSFPKLVINDGGTVRVRTSADNGFFVYERAQVTLNGGAIEIAAGGELEIADTAAAAGAGIFRGAGTISRFGAGSNFTMLNGGFIDVADISGAPGSGSTIGTLALTNGNLVQTAGGSLFFDFDPTLSGAADLIDITGGTATIAGGVDFDALAGSIVVGEWDFIRADLIDYTAADNMAALLTSLSPNPNWVISFGVVDFEGDQVLRLSVAAVPEPTTCLLVGLGAFGMLLNSRRRRG